TLCFDVINYHEYSAKRQGEYWNNPDLENNHGMAPELGGIGDIAERFVALSNEQLDGMEVWVTECGFDVNERSIQRALPIKGKSTEDTQADWILRTALLYSRYGIDRVFFYMLNDVNINSETQYDSSGLLANGRRRPSADYLLQTRKLLGDYYYTETINDDPLVDVYTSEDEKTIYVLTIPDQQGREENYTLDLGNGITKAKIHTLKKGNDTTASETLSVSDGKVNVSVSETPVFVEVL